jgi:hypothetical protein
MRVPFRGKVVGIPRLRNTRGRCAGTQEEVKTLNLLAEHISSKGWNVIFAKEEEDGITPALRNITINSSNTYKSQTFALLHEAGHLAVFSDPQYHERYPDGYIRYAGKTTTRSRRHRFDVLREEIAAWDEAEKIATHLGLNLNMRDMRDERNRSLMTYVEWLK